MTDTLHEQRSYTYRQGTAEDLPALLRLGIAAYSPYAAVLTPDNWEKLRRNLYDEDRLKALFDMSTTIVCVDGDRIIGKAFLILSGHPTPVYDASWSYIRSIGVHPDYSGQGIGRALTQRCIDGARQIGERHIALHTSEMMDAARHIYESLGFRILREIDPVFGKRYWLYLKEIIQPPGAVPGNQYPFS